MIRFYWCVATLLFISINQTSGQEENTIQWLKKLEDFKIQPVVALQLWSTYTLNEKVFDAETKEYKKVDNRFNTQLRRSRLGVKGQPFERIKFNLTTAIDLVGSDALAGTYGGGNNGANPRIRLWNAYVQWKVTRNTDLLHLTVGYFTPRLGRASITNPWRSTSMEKSWSQNYLRRHLTGIGPGRANGLNWGGVVKIREDQFQINYDVGLFNPLFAANLGNSTGNNFSPLLVGRLALQLGQAESQKYTLGHRVNYFGRRKGLSIGLGAAHQGNTDLFSESQTLSVDFLFNWKHTNLDGEWSWCQRATLSTDLTNDFQTGYVRASQNFVLGKRYVLEAVIMIMQMQGSTDVLAQEQAIALKSFSGEDGLLDVGINFYLQPNYKISLHYNHQIADAATAPPGAVVNNYFVQSGVGPIHRGDWLGLGLAIIL